MHATLLNATGDDHLGLTAGDAAAAAAARPAATPRARLRAQARRQRWAGFQRPWAVFRLDAPDFVAQQWVEQLANAGPHSPGPRAPWRSGPADGPPLPPALQREASLISGQI